MDGVAIAVQVGARLDAVAQLEPEVQAPLPIAVHRPQAYLHHRLGDGRRVPIARAVDYLQLHEDYLGLGDPPPHEMGRGRGWGLFVCCCCCCGIPRPSSPATLAGTLLGWK